MIVYHCSDTFFEVLKSGSYVTPQKEIAISFGTKKLGNQFYLYKFDVTERKYPSSASGKHRFLVTNTGMIGEVQPSYNEFDEWQNYQTCVPLLCTEVEIIFPPVFIN